MSVVFLFFPSLLSFSTTLRKAVCHAWERGKVGEDATVILFLSFVVVEIVGSDELIRNYKLDKPIILLIMSTIACLVKERLTHAAIVFKTRIIHIETKRQQHRM